MSIAADIAQFAIDHGPGSIQIADVFAATSPPAPTAAQILAATNLITAAGLGSITGPPQVPTGMTVAPGLVRATMVANLRAQGLLGRVTT
ncbi:MAG: hypothetical protein EPN98_21385 [Phenylobacterium sp.]|nr:MAG: hypothetical protein EPN98_21385 [Phenylobacterium sp.]